MSQQRLSHVAYPFLALSRAAIFLKYPSASVLGLVITFYFKKQNRVAEHETRMVWITMKFHKYLQRAGLVHRQNSWTSLRAVYYCEFI